MYPVQRSDDHTMLSSFSIVYITDIANIGTISFYSQKNIRGYNLNIRQFFLFTK